MSLGGTVSAYDSAVYLWHNTNSALFGILVSHVDDFAFCGDEKFEKNVIGELCTEGIILTHC